MNKLLIVDSDMLIDIARNDKTAIERLQQISATGNLRQVALRILSLVDSPLPLALHLRY